MLYVKLHSNGVFIARFIFAGLLLGGVDACNKDVMYAPHPSDPSLSKKGDIAPNGSSVGSPGNSAAGQTSSSSTNAQPPPLVQNALKPDEAYSMGMGKWTTNCRDLNELGVAGGSEDKIFSFEATQLTIYTFLFENSRSCEPGNVKSRAISHFDIQVSAGDIERNHALASDLLQSSATSLPTNTLLVQANPKDTRDGGRLLFELFDGTSAAIRYELNDWDESLPKGFDLRATLALLDTNSKLNIERYIDYSQSFVLVPARAARLELLK